MSNSKITIVAPLLMITVGTGWLLTTHQVLPGIDWVWVLGMAVVGILIMALGGIDKFTIVVGPFLLIATTFSLLRQTGRMTDKTEIPCLVIIAGFLVLLARFLPVPAPRWLKDEPGRKSEKEAG